MASKVYQWVLLSVLGISAVFAVFLIASDNVAPFTTQAQLHIPTSRIAAEVSAPVMKVAVQNGQNVKKGDLLISLDDTRYELALAEAKATLVQAEQNYQAKEQSLIGAQAILLQREQEANNATRHYKRNQQLSSRHLVSQERLDNSLAESNAQQQVVVAAKAQIAQIQAELIQSSDSGALAIARSHVELAKLDLTKTKIIAPVDGVISNLNLNAGTYVHAGTPILFLVDRKNAWVNADFNEKGVSHLKNNTQVRLVFDALPGTLFQGHIDGRELAIFDASSDNSGLAKVVNDARWIREQQKVRTQIKLNTIDPSLFSGSKVSVMVVSEGSMIDAIGHAWMRLLTQIRYLV